ncbi:MAG: restriction endonuclease subunit S [Pseudomonas protegens]|nr:MAG: restriction endonuclease subunit S [Pseudomonas protegens]
MSELPGGWITATLGDVAESILGGGTPSKNVAGNFSGDIPFMTVKDMKTSRPSNTQDKITNEALLSSSSNLIPAGTPIVCTRMGLGKIVVADFHTAINQDLKAIFLNQDVIHRDYFEYWYRSIAKELVAMGTGTTVKGITLKQLKSIELPVPSLNEQIYIASKLEDLLAQIGSIKSRIDELPSLIKRFRQSVFAAAVSGRLTAEWRLSNLEQAIELDELCDVPKTRRGVPDTVKFPEILDDLEIPNTWVWAPAAKLLKKGILLDLKDGNHGANHPKTSEFSAEGLPFITAANVSRLGSIDYLNAPKISGDALARLRVGFSEPGDVIFTHKGTVGRVAVNTKECVLTPQTTYYRTNKEILSNGYLWIFLQSDRFQIQTNEIKSQTTRDFIPITAQYELFHLIPPIQEQLEIAKRVEFLFTISNELEIRIDNALHLLNKLPHSTLSKAFQGHLSADWRTANPSLVSGDNSASSLLTKSKGQTSTRAQSINGTEKISKQAKGLPMAKGIIKISAALEAAGKPLSGQELLEAAGYPSDSGIDSLESFFLDIRESLEEGAIIKLPRDEDSQDWFAISK